MKRLIIYIASPLVLVLLTAAMAIHVNINPSAQGQSEYQLKDLFEFDFNISMAEAIRQIRNDKKLVLFSDRPEYRNQSIPLYNTEDQYFEYLGLTLNKSWISYENTSFPSFIRILPGKNSSVDRITFCEDKLYMIHKEFEYYAFQRQTMKDDIKSLDTFLLRFFPYKGSLDSLYTIEDNQEKGFCCTQQRYYKTKNELNSKNFPNGSFCEVTIKDRGQDPSYQFFNSTFKSPAIELALTYVNTYGVLIDLRGY